MACQDEAKFREVFEKADTVHDGKVTPMELKNMIVNEFGQNICDRDVAEMFCALDKNGDGKITLEEFLAEMGKKPRRAEFRKAFESVDTDHNGCLGKDDIRQLLVNCGCGVDDIEAMFNKVDANSDGTISLEEFMAMV